MMKRFLAFLLALAMVMSMSAATADTISINAGDVSWATDELDDVVHLNTLNAANSAMLAAEGDPNYHNATYDHIDVKVDGAYTVTVDGKEYELEGTIDQDTVVVYLNDENTTEYVYNDFDNTRTDGDQSELHRLEYNMSLGYNNRFAASLAGVYSDYMTVDKAWVSFVMSFAAADVPDLLKELDIWESTGDTYTIKFDKMKYTGIQECTGGRGMRSNGGTGTPTGLDLYLTAETVGLYITTGVMGIQKTIVDESNNLTTDETAFSFYVEKWNTESNEYQHVIFEDTAYSNVTDTEAAATKITVKGSDTVTLTGLPEGQYRVTEIQQDGYIIVDANGNVTDTYSYDFTIDTKEDETIPVLVFSNMKLTTKGGVSLNKIASAPEGADLPANVTITIMDDAGEAVWSGSVPVNGDTIYFPLDAGDYTLVESDDTIDGYTVTTTLNNQPELSFTVEAGSNTALTVNNVYTQTPTTGRLTIYKTFAGDEVTIPQNLAFDIVNSDGGVVKTIAYSEFVNGSYTINDLPFDTYTVTEVNNQVANHTVKVTGASATISASNLDAVMNIVNTYERKDANAVAFNLQKTIENAGRTPEAQDFQFELTAYLNKPETRGIQVADGQIKVYQGETEIVDANKDNKYILTLNTATTTSDLVTVYVNEADLPYLYLHIKELGHDEAGWSWKYSDAEYTYEQGAWTTELSENTAEFINNYDQIWGVPFIFTKTVEQYGNVDPGENTFYFEVIPHYDGEPVEGFYLHMSGQNGNVEQLSETEFSVTIDGPNTVTGSITVEGFDSNMPEYLIVREKAAEGDTAGWMHDGAEWKIVPLNGNWMDAEVYRDGVKVENGKLEFVNTYSQNFYEELRIPFSKTVVQTGTAEPGTNTFYFSYYAWNENGDVDVAVCNDPLNRYGKVEVVKNSAGMDVVAITVDGANTVNGYFKVSGMDSELPEYISVNELNGLEFELNESDLKAAGWTYDITTFPYDTVEVDGETWYRTHRWNAYLGKDENGDRFVRISRSDDGDTDKDEMAFVNTYSADEELPPPPQTGDNSNIALWIALMGASVLCFVALNKRRSA